MKEDLCIVNGKVSKVLLLKAVSQNEEDLLLVGLRKTLVHWTLIFVLC